MTQPRLFARGFDFPEGPVFDGEGNLYLVAMGSGDIPRVRPDGVVEAFANTGGKPNGLACGPEGLLYVCDAGRRAILTVTPAGIVATLVAEWAEGPFAGPNDLCFDREGGFYFTDPVGSDVANPVGRVFHCSQGQVRCVAEGLAFPNGLALTADQRTLYLVETLTRKVYACAVLDDGGLGPRQDLATLREGGVGGDGMALDVAGRLYVAHFGLGTVDIFSPAGEPLGELPAGGANPTNVAFGGPDGQDLYITEAETGGVYVQRSLAAGLALP